MSKTVKTVASIALPIVGNLIAPGIGGLIGGAIGGGINGGLPGAVLGGITGYASGPAVSGLAGNAAGSTLDAVTGVAGAQGPTYGTGIAGAVTGGGVRALGPTVSGVANSLSNAVSGGSDTLPWLPQVANGTLAPNPATSFSTYANAAAPASSSALTGLTTIGNQLSAQSTADAAQKAADAQVAAADRAVGYQQPYTELGTNAVSKINEIQADPTAYIQNNPLYNSLAEDAKRRLLANQAAKGKVGSGGTASALQDQLLQLGNGLVQQELGNLRADAGIGQNSANVSSNLTTGAGDAAAAGVVGKNNAYTQGYQNQISTLLALRNLSTAPSYQSIPTLSL